MIWKFEKVIYLNIVLIKTKEGKSIKRFVLLFIISIFVYFLGYTQNQSFFYKDGGTTPVKEVTCDKFSSITVKVPVPADVKNYDEFQYKILLSSSDVTARVYFS